MILHRLTIILFICRGLALESSFGFYPKGAQSCLNQSAKNAGCTGKDVKELNQCLCGLEDGNQDFIFGSARCINKDSPDDLDKTYDTMASACNNSGTSLSATKKQFQAAAEVNKLSSISSTASIAATSIEFTRTTAAPSTPASDTHKTTTAPTSTSSTSNSKQTEENTKSGLSTKTLSGIVIAACVGGIALIGTIIHFVIKQRRGHGMEANPTLPSYKYTPRHQTPMGFSASQDSSMWSQPRIFNPSLPQTLGSSIGGGRYQSLQAQDTSYDSASNHWNLYEMDGLGSRGIYHKAPQSK